MKVHVTAYFITLIAFVAIDFVWLTTTANTLYRAHLWRRLRLFRLCHL